MISCARARATRARHSELLAVAREGTTGTARLRRLQPCSSPRTQPSRVSPHPTPTRGWRLTSRVSASPFLRRRHTIEAHLGIKGGETTDDGLFTLTEVECLGACVNAPMIQVNDMFFEDLTPETTVKLLDDLKEGREVVVGPQNGRRNSLGPMGRTSLEGTPAGPYCRELPAPFVPPA